ncbi:hypothetical protein GPLA_4342 [Paraglaciecola polaris LMG 21857]|uniref:Uncharacterized protein n=1 Tax=Paraglaciecola polaris LMG 21857 TaxID=1129793 RepID=K6ZGT1_9ALTE|nr:hypothetical protein GPLA_4342 [Paraglaciecola polaris LMG 21857]
MLNFASAFISHLLLVYKFILPISLYFVDFVAKLLRILMILFLLK